MIEVEGWETHCDDCGEELIPDPHWSDERHCKSCNVVYLHPDSVEELEQRIADDSGVRYTLDEVLEKLKLD